MSKDTTTALAVIGNQEFAILRSDAGAQQQLIRDNLDGPVTERDIETIKVPAGGGIAWQVPTDGEDEVTKAFDGIIIAQRATRQYWASGIDEGGTSRPDCHSAGDIDLVPGVGTPGGNCRTCPLGQFNSDPDGGDGKACKDHILLFIMMPDSFLPICLQLPTMSIKTFKEHMVKKSRAGRRFSQAVTQFTLKEVLNKAGIMYSQVQFKSVANLSPEQSAETYRLGELFEASCDKATSEITQGDFVDPQDYAPGPKPEPKPVEPVEVK